MFLIVIGPPGSGKGTQARKISEVYKIPHISVGELYREIARENTKLGKKVKELIDAGFYVPDKITNEIVKRRLRKGDYKNGFILDGYPRTILQAKFLEKISKELNFRIDAVLDIEIPESETIKRLSNRRTCSSCGANFNLLTTKPKKFGICDLCGGKLYQREDDKEETIRTRLVIYKKKIKPVLKYYEKIGNLIKINGNQSIDNVFKEIRETLKDRVERTLVFIKPDGIERNLVGEIISRFEKAKLKIVAMKMIKVSKKFAEKQYPATEEQITGMGNKTLKATVEETGSVEEVRKIFGTTDPKKIGRTLRNWMVEFLISSPVIAMVLEGENAVERARKIAGYTDPSKAEKGTIRGDLGKDSIYRANMERRATRNLVHVSGNRKEAEREIKLWFGEEVIRKR